MQEKKVQQKDQQQKDQLENQLQKEQLENLAQAQDAALLAAKEAQLEDHLLAAQLAAKRNLEIEAYFKTEIGRFPRCAIDCA